MQPTTCRPASLRAGAAPVVDVGFPCAHYHTGYVGTPYGWNNLSGHIMYVVRRPLAIVMVFGP